MNDTINSIINAWKLYNKPGILTPDQILELKQDAAASLEAPSTVVGLMRDVERQIEQLREMVRMNNTRQEEIRALRDGVSTVFFFFFAILPRKIYQSPPISPAAHHKHSSSTPLLSSKPA